MKKILHFTTGVLVGAALFSGGTALAAGITASRSTQPIYVDGKQVSMTAYNIGGSNYIKLRDVGEAVGFNVYWDGTSVQVDSSSPYTGISPVTAPPTSQVTPSPASGQSSQDVDAMRQEIVDRTNAVRIANGQKALPTDPMLMQAAQVRAEEMAATYTFSHTRPDGTSRHTTTDCLYTSENICRIWQNNLDYRGAELAEQSVSGWTESLGHFQNMTEGNRCAIGVGVAKGYDTFGEVCWYCVQWFLRDGYSITWVDTPKIP